MPAPAPASPDKARYVRALFSRIVARYDLLNDLMTGGQHRRWRRDTARLAQPAGARALDLGTGTGDLALDLARYGARLVVALDFVPEMVQAARCKATSRRVACIRWLVGDALALPFPEQTFDCVTSAFVVRNVADPAAAFAEMYRVLRPGGRIVCLDTTRPRFWATGLLLKAFAVGARLLGRLVARDREAYGYLPASTAGFATAEELAHFMHQAGFVHVRYQRRGLGLIAIHVAERARTVPAARVPLGEQSP